MRKKGRRLQGVGLAPGIAQGTVYCFQPIQLDALARRRIQIEDIMAEQERLTRAIAQSQAQLERIRQEIVRTSGPEIGDIFSAHLGILDDREFLDHIRESLLREEANLEYIIAGQINLLEEKFTLLDSELARNRFADVQDVYYRLLRNLLGIEHVRTNPLERLSEPVVFAAERLIPSDVALLSPELLLGIVLEEGSTISHVAIISRAYGIPAVAGIPGLSGLVHTGTPVIIDGNQGTLVVDPLPAQVARYQEEKEKTAPPPPVITGHPEVCCTVDGKTVQLEASIASVAEARQSRAFGAAGIGLLRTELYYMSLTRLPEREEELAFYQQVLAALPGRPVTIRLLDLGADKALPYLPVPPEPDPQLGHRGIRYLLQHPDLFRRQLDRILSLPELSRVRLLLPFIATVEDLDLALEHIHQACRACGVTRRDFQLGIMVEIPVVALALEGFLTAVDFISIGTNDLLQYLFAASREVAAFEQYRRLDHPAVLFLIDRCVSLAREQGKTVTVCGEAAAHPETARLLIDRGVRALSVPVNSLPGLRQGLAEPACAG